MKAITYTKYGPPNVLKLNEVEEPAPRDNEVMIKVHAAEVTKADCELRSFRFPVKWFWLPLRFAMGIIRPKKQILGGYFAGEIFSIGSNVTKFEIGDLVFGATQLQMGAYGEYMCLPDSYTIVPMPHNINSEEAAAVPLGGLNALHFLRKANIQNGEKVLINGAGGSIGVFGVQIAKSMGAEVTAVDSAIKEAMLRRIGADNFINYSEEDFTKGSQKYDVIFDMVAGSSYSGCINALKPNGRYLTANPRMSKMLKSIVTTWLTDKSVYFAFAGERKEELLMLKKMIEEETIKPIVDRIYPMDQVTDAHTRVETEQRLGAIVITMRNLESRL